MYLAVLAHKPTLLHSVCCMCWVNWFLYTCRPVFPSVPNYVHCGSGANMFALASVYTWPAFQKFSTKHIVEGLSRLVRAPRAPLSHRFHPHLIPSNALSSTHSPSFLHLLFPFHLSMPEHKSRTLPLFSLLAKTVLSCHRQNRGVAVLQIWSRKSGVVETTL